MRKQSTVRALLALLLLGTMLLLCACPGGGGDTTCAHTFGEDGVCTKCGEIKPCEHTYGTDGVCTKCGDTCTHTFKDGVCTTCGAPKPDENIVYGEGTAIEGAGDKLAADAPALTPVTYDEASATEVAGAIFFRQAKFGNGAVSTVKDGGAVTLGANNATDKTYENAVLIFPAGLTIDGASGLTFKGVTFVGDVAVAGGTDVVFDSCRFVGGVTLSSKVSDVVFSACRLTGADTLVETKGTNITFLDCYAESRVAAIVDSGAGLYVQNCRFAGAGVAVSTTGIDAAVKYNSITLGETDTGIAVGNKAHNFIAAMNVIRGAQTSIAFEGADNAVAVSNTLISVTAKNNINLYVCDNAMGGRIVAENNNYFLADGNTFPEDGKSHVAVQSGNTNTNGDTLMDVDARLEVGADENLLPHVNKDQFVGEERKEFVRNPDNQTLNVHAYVSEALKTESYIFVAPGAYTVTTRLLLSGTKNKTIYAYGVYWEMPETPGKNNLTTHLQLNSTTNIVFKGLQVGYEEPASGQVHILKKMSGNRVLVVASAGMINEFTDSNENYYQYAAYWHPLSEGKDYVYRDLSLTGVAHQENGLMTVVVDAEVYDQVQPGDIFTCRAASGASTVSTNTTKGTVFKDMVIYGSSGGLCFVEDKNTGAVTYYRVADTSRSGELIDEETYNTYLALEAEYGVDLGVYIDEEERYRGSPAYISSIDATHVNRCAQGSQITSCLFENMCDDGTNQKGVHARLAEIKIEGDVATIIFKGNLSETRVDRNQSLVATGMCYPFTEGDRICIYTSAGQLICDTTTTSACTKIYTRPSYGIELEAEVDYRQVTVAASAISEEALKTLEKYDLRDDHWRSDNKVLVDNMSHSSNGFKIDNTMIKNTRSRGLLIKSSDGTVTNCTFRNNAKCGVAIIYEIYWGESGMSENLLIARNLFDNTSYSTANQVRYQHAPLIIMGLGGGTVSEDYLLYKNIDIIGNKFINRNVHVNRYAIYLQAVRDVVIEGNDFGTFDGESEENWAGAVGFNGAMNIKIENNTYSEMVALEQNFFGGFYKNVYGSDVEGVIPKDKED